MTKSEILEELEFCIQGYSDFVDGKIGLGAFSNYVTVLSMIKQNIETMEEKNEII